MDDPKSGLPLGSEFDKDAVPEVEPPPVYEQIVTETSEREVDFDNDSSGKSLTEKEQETPELSDFQAALKVLHPVCPDEKLKAILASARVSRIFPDNLLDKMGIIVMSRYEDTEGNDNVDFIQTLTLVQDAMLVGLEGKGIIDIMEMYGAAKEADLANLEKGLFN